MKKKRKKKRRRQQQKIEQQINKGDDGHRKDLSPDPDVEIE